MSFLALIPGPWKAGAAVLALLAVVGWHWNELRQARNAGRAAVLLEQAHEAAKRNNDATAADEASRACQRNPACRLSDDGHRRD